jgi:hypothetical protein
VAVDAIDGAVETKLHPQALRLIFEQQGKLAAVAHFVAWQLNRRSKRRLGMECRLDRPGLRGFELAERDAGVTQHLQAGLHPVAVAFGAQQYQEAVTAVVFEP